MWNLKLEVKKKGGILANADFDGLVAKLFSFFLKLASPGGASRIR